MSHKSKAHLVSHFVWRHRPTLSSGHFVKPFDKRTHFVQHTKRLFIKPGSLLTLTHRGIA